MAGECRLELEQEAGILQPSTLIGRERVAANGSSKLNFIPLKAVVPKL